MGNLPRGVVGLSSSLINWQGLSVDAALTGDKDLVLQALLAHPWILSTKNAEKIREEMLSAYMDYLRRFR